MLGGVVGQGAIVLYVLLLKVSISKYKGAERTSRASSGIVRVDITPRRADPAPTPSRMSSTTIAAGNGLAVMGACLTRRSTTNVSSTRDSSDRDSTNDASGDINSSSGGRRSDDASSARR